MNTEWRVSRRVAWFLLALLFWGVMGSGIVSRPPTARAADEPEAAAAADDTVDAPKTEKPKINFLWWVIKTSGIIGVLIFGLSIYFVATVSRLFWEFRLEVAVPPDILGRCQDLLTQRDFKGVYGVVKDDEAFFSRVLSTGIVELPNGLAEARDVMERVGESVRVEMEKKISMLAVLGTLGPMIGLLGTLSGMIKSFGEIARSGTGIDAGKVAEGISEALLLTFEGVSLSIPAIWFFAFFRNRVSVICTTASMEADQFLRHFAHAARSKGPAPAATAAGGATKAAPRLD